MENNSVTSNPLGQSLTQGSYLKDGAPEVVAKPVDSNGETSAVIAQPIGDSLQRNNIHAESASSETDEDEGLREALCLLFQAQLCPVFKELPDGYTSSENGYLSAAVSECAPYCCRNCIGISFSALAALAVVASVAFECKACDSLGEGDYCGAYCNDRVSDDCCKLSFLCFESGIRTIFTAQEPKTPCQRGGALAGTTAGGLVCIVAGASAADVWGKVQSLSR